MDASTDTELIVLISHGDESAFREVYDRFAAHLYRYTRKNISRAEDCEEIVQDVFVSLWERRESLEITCLRAYLFNAVRYKIIRYMQHEKVKQKYAAHFRVLEAISEPEETEHALPPDLKPVLEKYIVALPERCQYAFRLRLYGNLSNTEIAQRMQITKKTVELYMFKAFSHLRNAYGDIFSVG